MLVILSHCDLGYLVAKVNQRGDLCPEHLL